MSLLFRIVAIIEEEDVDDVDDFDDDGMFSWSNNQPDLVRFSFGVFPTLGCFVSDDELHQFSSPFLPSTPAVGYGNKMQQKPLGRFRPTPEGPRCLSFCQSMESFST